MSDRDYDQALTNLLPPGPAWTRQQGSPGSAVLTSGANVLSRIDAIAMRLIDEADPRTCTETLRTGSVFTGSQTSACRPLTT